MDAIVASSRAQEAGGDGYVAGFTRKRADGWSRAPRGVRRDRAGTDRGVAVPAQRQLGAVLHLAKLFAGLLDAHRCCGNDLALEVATRLAGYVERKLAPLDHAQMQQVLDCEFGGMPESLAVLSQRTGDARWLALARRFRHDRVLDPLVAGEDRLNRLHANTQIPKLLGAARGFEADGDRGDAAAALFFWERVVHHHSYAIGGNSDREYFRPPARCLTTSPSRPASTATRSMMRLSRILHGWEGQARYFDFYERALYNHVLSQQHPDGGRYTYMTPLLTGEARSHSDPEGQFWCCVGTGMESHAQYTDAIYGFRDGELLVNLYIPSTFDDPARGLSLRMESGLPDDGIVRITLGPLRAGALPALRLRVPEWAGDCRSGSTGAGEVRDARRYARIRRASSEATGSRSGSRCRCARALRRPPHAGVPAARGPACSRPTSARRTSRGTESNRGCRTASRRHSANRRADAGACRCRRIPRASTSCRSTPCTNGGGRSTSTAGPRQRRRHEADRPGAAPGNRRCASRASTTSCSATRERAGPRAGRHRRLVRGQLPAGKRPRRARRGHAAVHPARGAPRGGAACATGARNTAAVSPSRSTAASLHAYSTADGHDFVMVDYPLPTDLRDPPADGWQVRIVPDAGYSAGPVFGAGCWRADHGVGRPPPAVREAAWPRSVEQREQVRDAAARIRTPSAGCAGAW